MGCLQTGGGQGVLQGREGLCVCPRPPRARGQCSSPWGGRAVGLGGCDSPHRGGRFWLLLGDVTGVRESPHTHTQTLPSPGMGSVTPPLPQFPPYLRRTGGYRSFINRNPPPLQPVLPRACPSLLINYGDLRASLIPAPGALQRHPECHGKGQEPCSFHVSALLLPYRMPCPCPVSTQPSPSPSAAEAMLHPDPALTERGGPLVSSPPRSPCPSAAAESHQEECPACSALSALSPCPLPGLDPWPPRPLAVRLG